MKFAEQWMLLLALPVLATLAALYIYAAYRKKSLLEKLLNRAADDPDAVHLSYRARRWKMFLFALAAFLLIIAAARPYWSKSRLPGGTPGRDILIVFDVSRSMMASDLPPSRMEQAKFLVREIIRSNPEDRFGIAAFAGNAFLSCPLVSDPAVLQEYLNELNVNTVPLGGTNIERALRCAEQAFAGAEGDHRAVILLTDGDELTGDSSKLAEKFRKNNIPILIAGFGDPAVAAPVPDGAGGIMRSSSGTPAASKLNEKALMRLAAESGGVYVRSTVGDTGFAVLQKRLSALGKSADGEKNWKREVIDERFSLFLLGAFVVLVIYALISERAVPRTQFPRQMLLILAALTLCGKLAGAQLEKTEKPEKLPSDPAELYNIALQKQEKGDADAVKLYADVIRAAAGNSELQSRALHNSAVWEHGKVRKAMQSSRQLLAAQKLDDSLKELEKAQSDMASASELYSQVLAINALVSDVPVANLRKLENDRIELEKLKKAIEELKKKQQEARKKAQQAQQQNQQQQNQKQQQNQQKQQQQNQKQQQNQQQQSGNSSRQAAQAAQDLANAARKLDQKDLAKSSDAAAKELEKAAKSQKQQQFDQAQKHIEKALEALGKEDKKDNKTGNSGKDKKEKSAQKEQSSAAPGGEKKDKKEESASGVARKLRMLNDENRELRNKMQMRAPAPMRRVEKDW